MPARALSADFEEFPAVDLRHLEFISGLQVEEFSITPEVIKPLQKATITWKVSHEDGRQVPDLWLTGVGKIPPSGSVEVAPLQTTAYQLQWKVLHRGWNGGTRKLTVDRSGCFRTPAGDLHLLLTGNVQIAFLTKFPTLVDEWLDSDGNDTSWTVVHESGITMSIGFRDRSGPQEVNARVTIQIVLGLVNGRLTYQIAKWELFRAASDRTDGSTTAEGFFPPLSAYLEPAGGPDTLHQRVVDQMALLISIWFPKSKLVLVGIETGDGNLTFLRSMPVHGLPRLT